MTGSNLARRRWLARCDRCFQPQLVEGEAGACAACGAQLPAQPVPTDAHRPEASSASGVDASLGGGSRLLLSGRHLTWVPRTGPRVDVELANLASVELRCRPVYESLCLTALSGALAWATPWTAPRVMIACVAVLSLVAMLTQKRWLLDLIDRSGRRATLSLGIGAVQSPLAQRVLSAWATFREELTARGISCDS